MIHALLVAFVLVCLLYLPVSIGTVMFLDWVNESEARREERAARRAARRARKADMKKPYQGLSREEWLQAKRRQAVRRKTILKWLGVGVGLAAWIGLGLWLEKLRS